VGFGAGMAVTTANNVIAIGHAGLNVNDSCFIGNIRDRQTGNDAVSVMIDSFGKLGTTVSSRRFKKEIKTMDKASEAILALKPVTFHYKTDNTNKPQFGLIAEEVAEVNPDLVVRDKNGEIYTVRYDAVNVMLLNEFLKRAQKSAGTKIYSCDTGRDYRRLKVHSCQTGSAKCSAREGFSVSNRPTAKENGSAHDTPQRAAEQIQKVTVQVEMSKPMPQIAMNNR
jgi:hypothetical protein